MARTARCALVLAIVGIVVAGCSDSSTPISQQTCRELVDTFADIKDRLSPEESFDTWTQASKDAGQIRARVAALGGCPNRPSLR